MSISQLGPATVEFVARPRAVSVVHKKNSHNCRFRPWSNGKIIAPKKGHAKSRKVGAVKKKVNASNKVPGQNEILVKAEAHGCKLSASSLF